MIFDYMFNPPGLAGVQTTMAEGILCMFAFVFALLFALSVHEYAHAFVAYKCGDNTAALYGRLTVNPLKHIDYFGALMLFLVGFGWAKPVPVNFNNLKHRKRDSVFVSLAGILANILLAFVFTGLWMLITTFVPTGFLAENRFVYMLVYLVYYFLLFSILLNIGLALFNILPLYPLDGYRVLEVFFGGENKVTAFLRQYSFIIFVVIIIWNYIPIFSPFDWYITTLRDLLLNVFTWFWGLFGLV